MQTLTINIEDGGKTEIKVAGCPGPGCSDLTRAIEKALGKTVSDMKTPEFSQQVRQQSQAKAGA